MNPRHELGSSEHKIDRSALALGLALMGIALFRGLTANQVWFGIPDQDVVNLAAQGAFVAGCASTVWGLRSVFFTSK